ncbi:hypothetical protein [Clostridium sp.]|uniref:hypothetical protein n=1 Tax=Clostridium sp. TaxID=1506 RepID=UPI002FCB3705
MGVGGGAGWTFIAIVTVIYYRSGRWKNKSLVKISKAKEELTEENVSKDTP